MGGKWPTAFRKWIVYLSLCIVAPPTPLPCESCKDGNGLPDAVRALLQNRFPKWKIVDLADLDPEDRRLWVSAHPSVCPGIAPGKFGPQREGYALSLIKPLGHDEYHETLVFVVKRKVGYYVIVLAPDLKMTGTVYVVWKQPAGMYEDAERTHKVRAAWPIITYEAIESDAIAYYWKDGHFKPLTLSE